jgi:glycosyltransferase involved in cell wall biosynthesis
VSKFTRTHLSYFARFILWAQRRSWLLPRSIRTVATRLLGPIRSASDRDPVDDWSAPLIAHGTMPLDLPIAEIGPVLQPAPSPAREQLSTKQRSTEASDSRLRCLIVTSTLDAGGMEEFVAFLTRYLPAWGLDTTVMCADYLTGGAHGGRLAATLRSEGILVIDAFHSDGGQWLAANRPDVISAHAPPEWFLEAACALSIPVVETLHGVPTPIGTDWRKEISRSRGITTLVAVSELVRRQYLRGNPGFAQDAIITIPNAFNVMHRPAINRVQARTWLGLNDEFLFLSLARHVLQKNAYGLVAAFSDVARAIPRAHLLIAGRADDWVYTEQVRLLRDGLSERDRIHLRDNLSNPSVLLAAADGFILNSFFEGWPLAPMEALCAGLPVVMSDVGGAREQIGVNGERGYLVPNPLGDAEAVNWESAGRERFRPQLNKDALVAAMTSVIKDRKRWAEGRLDLAEESKRRFEARTCAEQHARVLRRAAALHPR